jgi:carbamoyl-phosphate synthase large subunit
MKRILVTGAGGSAAFNFIDSLRIAEEKFYIIGTDVNKEHLELSNADKKYLVPRCSDTSYITKINEIIKKEKIDFLHPQPDVEVAFISEHREKFNTKTMLPAQEAIKMCHDKMALNKLLKNQGVPVPLSILISDKYELKAAMNELSKENDKVWLRAIKGAGSKASLPVTELAHAEFWIDYWSKMKNVGYGEFMVAEYLPGKEFAFQSIWKDGKLITSQARERLEYVFGNLTVSGQSSSPSIAKTVHRDDVNKNATAAIMAVDPKATGIFCVDMKENCKGIPCVTEINIGRFFTTSNFIAYAGSNMPYYFIKLGLEEHIPSLPQYNAVPENLFWVRLIDCGYKLIKDSEWTSIKI